MHDPAHRPTADALDAAHKLRASSPAAAVVVPHPGDDVADRQVVLPLVRPIEIISGCPQSSQVTRRNPDGKALNGSSRASRPLGSGSLP